MRILFVDDEEALLQSVQRMLFDRTEEWDLQISSSAQQALQMLAAEPFDVLVSDVRMPGVGGADFIHEVHRRHPRVVRIVLSGRATEEYARDLVFVAHQYLAKPCTAEELTQLIERTYTLLATLDNDVLRSAVGGVERLPGIPKIYQKLTVLLNSPRASTEDVAKLIGQDPSISAKLLQVANSAFFARRVTVRDLRSAVVHLGLQTVRNLVLQTEVFHRGESDFPWKPGELQALQRHAIQMAALAGAMFPVGPERESAFTAGLLCDVGQLALAHAVRDKFIEARRLAEREKLPQLEAERRTLSATHADVGAFLLGLWGLPHSIVESVAAHHDPNRIASPRFEAPAGVYIAEAIVSGTEVDPELIEKLGLKTQLQKWQELAHNRGETK